MNKRIEELTIDEKIGQLIMFGFHSTTLDEHARSLIRDHRVGNVILFARNAADPEQIFQLNQSLQELAEAELGVPLFISIDQEGGMVTRIKHGATFFPGAMTTTASGDPASAHQIGLHMGRELHALGINMNLAPVLDTNNNPHNPVIGVRSYSDDPNVVGTYGSAFVTGLQEHVLATAKHFPGHGDTHVDSHLALPTIDADKARLETLELIPFKQAIAAGLKVVMSSHINFSAINENGLPCTLSHNCLTNLLRQELKFDGLIITDCMQMKAIQHHYTTPEGALMAIQAGADLVCISHDSDLQIAAVRRIRAAVDSGELPMDVLDDRVARVLAFKSKLLPVPSAYEDVRPIIADLATKSYVQSIVDNAVTLVRGTPFAQQGKVLVIASSPLATTIADEDDGTIDILAAVNGRLPEFTTHRIPVRPEPADIETVLELASTFDQVVCCTYNANIHTTQLDLVKALQRQVSRLHVMTMRNPYDTLFAPELKNVTCFYEYTPNSIRSLIKYLSGELKPQGRLPVHDV